MHSEHPDNILKRTSYQIGCSFDEAVRGETDLVFLEGEYDTQIVQHCHIEPPISYAYMEKDRIVVVSSTQIPHIVRRVCGQALGIPWGKIRVIKPYIGGGFGNKQEVLYEPLNAFLSMQVGGCLLYTSVFFFNIIKRTSFFRYKNGVPNSKNF